jgi:hypothetical protein
VRKIPKAVLALIPVARVTAETPSGLELPERHRSIRNALTTAPTSFGTRAAVFFVGFPLVFFKALLPYSFAPTRSAGSQSLDFLDGGGIVQR